MSIRQTVRLRRGLALYWPSGDDDDDTTPTTQPPLLYSSSSRTAPTVAVSENAAMRSLNGPLTSKNGNAMPNDKPNPTIGQRPLVPTLSVSRMKAANTATTPLTPRVAGSTPANVSTPVLRPATRQDTTPNTSGRERERERDGRTTPVSYLSDTITPRSASRRSRVNSANSTPTSTPATSSVGAPTSRPLQNSIDNTPYGAGLASDSARRKAFVSFSPQTPENGNAQGRLQSQQQSQASGKFFYASDVKSNASQPSRKRSVTQKLSSSLHTNGNANSASAHSPGLAPAAPETEERSKARFFHANGAPDTASMSTQSPARPGSTLSASSSSEAPRLASDTQRLTSLADNSTNCVFNSTSTQTSPRISFRRTSQSVVNDDIDGNGSVSSSITSRHAGTRSVDYLDLLSVAEELSEPSDPVASRDPQSDIVDETSVLSADEGQEPPAISDEPEDSGSRKPAEAGKTLQRMNELAAEARRERKVLDLEITNSSLSTINRTLERDMRKQNAELERYRRLARSGRLSGTSVSRSTMGNGNDTASLSDMSEEEHEEKEGEEDCPEPSSVGDRCSTSPPLAEGDAQHQQADDQGLQLDLTKHQQLLANSQKMNQSLKRCLGWTEELINAGRSALEYRIHANDVVLRGRVLATYEDPEDETSSHISSMLDHSREDHGDDFRIRGKDDEDSGIDLEQRCDGVP